MRFLLLTGPPAVGKMTIGRWIAATSDFRLFHNHHTIEPLLEVFGYGTPAFTTLDLEFRRRVIEEAAGAGLDLIFTVVWDFADPVDTRYVEHITAPYREMGAPVRVAELLAPLSVRLARNHGQDRLAAKPSKRDLEWSDRNVRDLERHVLDSADDGVAPEATALLQRLGHRRFDTTGRSVADTAADVRTWVEAGTS
ncbi:hypothetical protein [Pseudactinotalea sp. Z1748]|uniref:hypothetical protein n=1 Tax=Pseudactinotalea sp. Z1748 TaxID=3413027 RepID=UPI003C7C7B4D